MEQWKLDFIKKHPLPTFTHVQGTYCADGKPVMRTPSMGPTVCIPEEIPLNRVPENVIGAYCALNNLMYDNFCMVYEHYPKTACAVASNDGSHTLFFMEKRLPHLLNISEELLTWCIEEDKKGIYKDL